MPSFKDELNQALLPKGNLYQSIEEQLDKAMSFLFEKEINDALESIKNDILRQCKNAQYEYLGGMKNVTGSVRLSHISSFTVSPRSGWDELFIAMRQGLDLGKYLVDYPDFSISHHTSDGESLVFSYTLVNRVEHSYPFIRSYHSYRLTDIAKKIISVIQSKAASDDIAVGLSGIDIGNWGSVTLIPDGGDDSAYNWHGGLGSVSLKYSIYF